MRYVWVVMSPMQAIGSDRLTPVVSFTSLDFPWNLIEEVPVFLYVVVSELTVNIFVTDALDSQAGTGYVAFDTPRYTSRGRWSPRIVGSA